MRISGGLALVGAVVAEFVAGSGGYFAWKSFQPKPPTLVVTAKVERAPSLRSIVSATGEIRAKEFVDIQASQRERLRVFLGTQRSAKA